MICKSLVFSAVFLAVLSVSWAKYSDCGSVAGTIESVEVSKCATSARRCILKRNSNVTMTLNFKPNAPSDTVKPIVHGVIMGVDFPFELPNPDGCKDSGITCPIQPDTSYQFVITLPILGSYPRVTVDVKWQLQNADGKDIVCVLIPSKLA